MFTQEIRWSPRAVWLLFGWFLISLVAVLAPGRSSPGRELAALVIAGLYVLMIRTFTTLRITVDESTLTVGYGRLRERVPLTRIVACRPTTYRWYEWGGWGIRLGWRARLYNVPGDRGVAVELRLEDGSRLLFSSPDPFAVCQALRERRPEPGDGVAEAPAG
jgi:hypothetical protein